MNVMFTSFPRRQRGASMLVATVFLLLIVALFGGIGLRLASTDITDTAVQNDGVEALFLAESGLERALQRLNAGIPCTAAGLGSDGLQTLGRGDFQILSAITVGPLCRVQVRGRVLLGGAMRAQRRIEGDLAVSRGGWAVGDNGTIFNWNGSAWTTSGFTNSAPPNRDLNAVFCISANDCWAVGQTGIFVHWNGSVWDDNGVVESVVNQELNSVFCIASDDCWAVGNNGTVAYWDGSSWEDSGFIENLSNADLNGLYCNASDDCWAVGDEFNNDGLIAHWDGSSWENETGGAFTVSTPGLDLHSVHCVSATDCWAVGEPTGGEGITVDWLPATSVWTNSDVSNNSPDEDLNGVYCIASNECWAVGNNRGGRGSLSRWNGSGWVVSGFTNNTPNEDLNSVYCIGSGDCWAIGDDGAAAHLSGTTWSSVATPTTTRNLHAVHFPDGGGGGTTGVQNWREIIQ
jgi:hypothetical protein